MRVPWRRDERKAIFKERTSEQSMWGLLDQTRFTVLALISLARWLVLALCLLSLTGRGKTGSKLKTSKDSLWKGIYLKNYAIWFNLTWQIVWITSQYSWICNIWQCKENEIFKKLPWDNWLVRGELPSKSCTETNPRQIKELFLLNQSINKLQTARNEYLTRF